MRKTSLDPRGIYELAKVFGEVPALSSYHERIKAMPIELIREFTAFVGTRLINRFAATAISSRTSVTTRSSL